jgi:glucosamine--fructose-6-phosphate aminotransferase (isomerizing)
MCGIVGYLGNHNYYDYVINGLKLLQNRGYDSVGVSYIINRELNTIKFASTATNDSILLLENELQKISHETPQIRGIRCDDEDTFSAFEKRKDLYKMENISTISIGHTRWATHGGKTNENAHPHHDNRDRISIVHNGIIENFQELKNQLLKEGYFFRSRTDTEVIAVLIGKYLDLHFSVEESIQKTVDQLLGTWALVIIHRDFHKKIWITRNGSPLLLGIDDEYIMIASEQIAFGNYIQKYIVIDNHDLIEISKDDGITYNKDIQRYSVKEKHHMQLDTLDCSHWMLKEIREQPNCILRAMNYGGRLDMSGLVKLGGLDSYSSRLLQIDHLIILGCGTSYHAGLWAMDIFKSLDILDTISVYDGAEFQYKDIPKKGITGFILLSQSGETKDLHRCIQIAKDNDIITIGVVNVVDSIIARETDCGVYLNAGREVSVASTKSFTNQCIVLTIIALWLSQKKNTCIEKQKVIINDIRNISFQIQSILNNNENVLNIVKKIDTHSLFVLGKGRNEAIAKEGALKIKEVSYIHAEGYSSSALKHGPFALIEQDLPIILLDIDDIYREKNNNVYNEIIGRNAYVIRITDEYVENIQHDNCDQLMIDKNRTFSGLLANVYIQIIAYYLSLERGYNPDFPRNLAKVVTVE